MSGKQLPGSLSAYSLMSPKARRKISALLAPFMFTAAIGFLAGLATLVVIWVDVPGLQERALEAAGQENAHSEMLKIHHESSWTPAVVTAGMMILWPLFLGEAIFYWATRPWTRRYLSYHIRCLAFCIVPPLRMCARSPEVGDAMWFPRLGWRARNDDLRDQLKRIFGLPMLGIAILILPVLGIEFFLKDQVAEYQILRFGLHFSTGLIWFAFTAEFIIMISAAENRLDYCKKHWLDLAIILLPLISFLRSLQIVRASRLAKLTKVQQLSKMFRVYRLRGVSTKALRALLLLEVAERLLRPKPAKHLVKLRLEHRRLTRELRELEALIERVESVHVESLKSQKEKNLSGGK